MKWNDFYKNRSVIDLLLLIGLDSIPSVWVPLGVPFTKIFLFLLFFSLFFSGWFLFLFLFFGAESHRGIEYSFCVKVISFGTPKQRRFPLPPRRVQRLGHSVICWLLPLVKSYNAGGQPHGRRPTTEWPQYPMCVTCIKFIYL